MNRKQNQPVPTNDEPGLAWLKDAVRQLRLAWRLFFDERVPLWTKIIPSVVIGYVFFPWDIIPDFAPVLGQMDDIAVFLIGVKLFIEMSPPAVVREHLKMLGARIEEWHVEEESDDAPDILEGQYQLHEAKPGESDREDA